MTTILTINDTDVLDDGRVKANSNFSNLNTDKIETSAKAAASGIASLDSNSKVVQDPANATATPTASKIPIADGSGKLDG
jgi:hypothetical protein